MDEYGFYANDDQMWPKFLDFSLLLRKNPRKNLNQEIDPTDNQTRPIEWETKIADVDGHLVCKSQWGVSPTLEEGN